MSQSLIDLYRRREMCVINLDQATADVVKARQQVSKCLVGLMSAPETKGHPLMITPNITPDVIAMWIMDNASAICTILDNQER